MAAAEEVFLQSDAGVFDARNDSVRTDTDEGDHSGPPTFHLGRKANAAGAKLVVSQLIGAGGGAVDDVGDAKLEVEQFITFEGREKARREAAGVEGGPEAVTGPAEVTTNGGGVKPWVNTSKKHDEIFGDEIRDTFVVRCEKLRFGGLPGR